MMRNRPLMLSLQFVDRSDFAIPKLGVYEIDSRTLRLVLSLIVFLVSIPLRSPKRMLDVVTETLSRL